MDFKQLLSMVQNPPEGIMPEGIFDDLQAAYDSKPDFSAELQEMTGARDALQEKFDGLTEKFSGAQDKISDLVNKNFELLKSVGVGGGMPAGLDGSGSGDLSPTIPGTDHQNNPQDAIDNLFTKEK